MVAWLITMVPGVEEEVIAVLNYRRSGAHVGRVMEQLYVQKRMDPSAWLEYAKTGTTHCPAKHAVIDGVPWGEEWVCGSGDRMFWARKVDNLRVELDAHGREHFKWTERKRPDSTGVAESLGLHRQNQVT